MTIPQPIEEPRDPPPQRRRPFRFDRHALLLDLAVWTVFASFVALYRVTSSGDAPTVRAAVELTLYCFLTSYAWAALTPAIFWVAWRWGIEGPRWVLRVVMLMALGLLVSALALVLGDVVRVLLLGEPAPRLSLRYAADIVSRRWYLGEFVTYTTVLAAGLAWDYFARYRERLEETVRLEARGARMEAEAARLEATTAHLQAQLAEARIAMLRSQLNPHFLFNTLNAVGALMDQDPQGGRRMLALLSELLRSALQAPTDAEVPLSEELLLSERYLEIMEIRYQGRLQTSVRADPEVTAALVPGSILQPIIENAVKHGIGKAGGHGRIEVRARRADEALILTVCDTGADEGRRDGRAPGLDAGGWGIGLRYTRVRLESLYGPWQSFELRPAAGRGTIAEITLPYHTRAELREAGEPAAV